MELRFRGVLLWLRKKKRGKMLREHDFEIGRFGWLRYWEDVESRIAEGSISFFNSRFIADVVEFVDGEVLKFTRKSY